MPEEQSVTLLDTPAAVGAAVLHARVQPATQPWLEELLGSGSRRGSLLLVDDDSGLREILQSVLEREGHRVHTAGNGLQGLRLAKVLRPELIVLNFLMPVMDGLSALRALKKDPIISYLKVVMYSAVSDFDRFRGESLEAGAVDCLHTPFELKTFVAVVERALRAR